MVNILNNLYSTKSKDYPNKTFFNSEDGSSLYGEVTQKGTDNLVKYFDNYFNKDTVFYDLGSGLGKMVIHIGLKYGVKKSVGIELSKERYQAAMFLKEKYAPTNNNILFYNTSFYKYDLKDATIIYIDNTTSTSEANIKILSQIPSGCLYIFKASRGYFKEIDYKTEQNLVERTYNQSQISWFIKE